MSLDLTSLTQAVAQHGRVARVVVAEVKGSVPREVGAAMLVWPGGQSGTIGGGALEYEATARARAAFERHGDRLDHAPLGPGLGQCCGGAVTLLTEIFDAQRLDDLTGALYARPEPGGPPDMPLAIRRIFADARGQGQSPGHQRAGGWIVEPLERDRKPIWIYGAGHVGRALVHTLTPLPDFAITWIDTAPDRFPNSVTEAVNLLPAPDPVATCALAPDAATHLILTYSHALDLELCHRLLSRQTGGIGLIGSRTKWARFRSRLAQLGHSPAQISRITCPIGDPSFGKHPQAIAVSVAASLLSGQMLQSFAPIVPSTPRQAQT